MSLIIRVTRFEAFLLRFPMYTFIKFNTDFESDYPSTCVHDKYRVTVLRYIQSVKYLSGIYVKHCKSVF